MHQPPELKTPSRRIRDESTPGGAAHCAETQAFVRQGRNLFDSDDGHAMQPFAAEIPFLALDESQHLMPAVLDGQIGDLFRKSTCPEDGESVLAGSIGQG